MLPVLRVMELLELMNVSRPVNNVRLLAEVQVESPPALKVISLPVETVQSWPRVCEKSFPVTNRASAGVCISRLFPGDTSRSWGELMPRSDNVPFVLKEKPVSLKNDAPWPKSRFRVPSGPELPDTTGSASQRKVCNCDLLPSKTEACRSNGFDGNDWLEVAGAVGAMATLP